MNKYLTRKNIVDHFTLVRSKGDGNNLKKRLRQWQHSRSWARLICEAERMWTLESKELKRLGIEKNDNYAAIVDMQQDITIPQHSERDKDIAGIPSAFTNVT